MADSSNFLINLLSSDTKSFDSSSSLNKLLYKNIQTPYIDVNGNQIKINSNFLIIKKFTGIDAIYIQNALSGMYKNIQIVFTTSGNIWIGEITSYPDNALLIYVNPIVNKKFDGSSRIPEIGSRINTEILQRKDFVMSHTKKWILVSDANDSSKKIYYLLYNPFHSKDMKNLYYHSKYDDNFQNIVRRYCSVVDDDKKTQPGTRFYSDVSCNCLMPDDCIDNGYGVYIKDLISRNTLGKKCVCIAPYCNTGEDIKYSTVDKDSFFSNYKNEEIQRDVALEANTINKGEDFCTIDNNICTVLFNAGGDIKTNNSPIIQSCNNSFPDSSKKSDKKSITLIVYIGISIFVILIIVIVILIVFVFIKKNTIKVQ